MKKKLKKILTGFKKNIIKNKYLYIACIVTLVALIFTHLNTFLSNDDLSYSFYLRGTNRISSIGQAIYQQIGDYKLINGRFIVHVIIQILLIFGKSFWSFINPLMIISTILLLIGIVRSYNKKTEPLLSFLFGIGMFLLVGNYKDVIYWVAGSVNYIWVSVFLLICLFIFYKKGFCKIKIINAFIIFTLCAIHECTMAFTIIFILGNMIYDFIKNKKINKDYLLYMLSLSGAAVLLLSPANNLRMNADEVWNSMNFIQKVLTAMPVVSKNLFNLTNVNNLLPYLFIIAVIFNLNTKKKNKLSAIISIGLVLIALGCILTQSAWMYVLLTLVLVTAEYYGNYQNNRFELCILSLSCYAVAFSSIITPLYAAGRTNYYFYIYMILFVLLNFNTVLSNIKIITKKAYRLIPITIVLIFAVMIGREIVIYKNIGDYHRSRLESIETYKKSNFEGELALEKIPNKYSKYHIDANKPDKGWYTHRYFTQYYGLPLETEIVFK